jgi:hypothetical protein
VLNRCTRRLFPVYRAHDGGCRGAKAAKAAARTGRWRIEVVERSATAVGFEVFAAAFIRLATAQHHAPPLDEPMSFNLNRNLDWHSRGDSNAETLFVKAEHVFDRVHDGRFAMLETV